MEGMANMATRVGPGQAGDGPRGVIPLQHDDPTAIGRYRLTGRLGSGGMGVVYLGLDPARRPVAVKVIRADLAADPEFRARFADEVSAARRVAPFCTAQVLDADPDARLPYLVTEYIDGARLDEIVTSRGPLPLSMLQGVAVGVASALTAIHGAGIVHRDLKPSNVLLSYSGPRVIDFGIARALDAVVGRTRSGLVLGSAGWMAPEQMEGAPVGPAADVFAWGLLIAYSGVGRHPFGDGPPLEVAQRMVIDRPSLDGVPVDMRPLVEAALVRDPRARPSAERLVLSLLGDRGGGPRHDTRAVVTEVLDGTWPKRRRSGGAVGAAVPGAVAGYAAGQDLRGQPSRGQGFARTTVDPHERPAPTRFGPPTMAPAARDGRTRPAVPDGTSRRYEPGRRYDEDRRSGDGYNSKDFNRSVDWGDVERGDDAYRGGGPVRPAPRAGPAADSVRADERRPGDRRLDGVRLDDRGRAGSWGAAGPPRAWGEEDRARPVAPRRRRRRMRIPGKRLIILVVLIMLVMSGIERAGRIWDEQRGHLQEQVWTHIQDGFQHEVVDRVRKAVDNVRSGSGPSG